tara:strand:- start:26 stop:304 length:279 start_codon:yes stop_codon:yes gene_type:complete
MADFRELERDVPVEGDTAKNTELSTNQSLKTQFKAENCEVFTQPGLRPAFTSIQHTHQGVFVHLSAEWFTASGTSMRSTLPTIISKMGFTKH